MKRPTVLSLFFFSFLLFISGISCNKPKNDKSILDQMVNMQFFDSEYKIANDDKQSKDRRLAAIKMLHKEANQLRIDSLKCKVLRLEATLLNKYGDPTAALKKSYELLELAEKNGDSIYIGYAFYKLGYYNKKLENYLESFKYYNNAFKVRRDINDSVKAGRSLLAMSNIQKTLGDYNASKTTATDGLKYLGGSSEYRYIAGLYHNISRSFWDLNNPNEALAWNTKIMKLVKDSIALKKIGRRNISIFKNTRANILADQNKYEESIAILESLVQNKEQLPSIKDYTIALSNLGFIKFLQNPNNDETEGLLSEAFKIRTERKDIVGQFRSNIHLTKYYKNKNIEKAIQYAEQAYLNANRRNQYESLLEVLTLLTELKPNSLVDHQRFKDTSMKLMELRKKTREIYAPTRFENENLLKENEAKNKKISEVRTQNTIYLLGMLLLLTSIAFAIYFFRQRTKYLAQQNQVVQFQASYETETRISKRLHDDLGNDIFQVMLQYQNDPKDPHIITKLNAAYSKARDISRENNEFETDEEYPEELNNMLQNYTNNGIQLMARGLDGINWETFDTPIKITVYRVLQELMTNMQKHSKASLVVLKFVDTPDVLKITYSDNGVGMKKDHLHSKNGLRNTENRIRAIGGTLIFDSQMEKGFKASIEIPS